MQAPCTLLPFPHDVHLLQPARVCDKASKAVLNATQSHCVLHDVSFTQAIEIRGAASDIVAMLHLVLAPSTCSEGPSGLLRETRTTIHGPNTLAAPSSLAPARYMWLPSSGGPVDTVWLWVHAAALDDVLGMLRTLQGLHPHPSEMTPNEPATHRGPSVHTGKAGPKLQINVASPFLCRFEVRGAKADNVVASVCQGLAAGHGDWISNGGLHDHATMAQGLGNNR